MDVHSSTWRYFLVGTFLLLLLLGCGGNPQNQFTVDTASLKITPPYSHDFGMVTVGESKTADFIVANKGRAPALAMGGVFTNSMFNYSGGDYPGNGGDCDDTLEIEESCMVQIEFAPEYGGDFFDVLRIQYHDGVEARSTNLPTLTGKGIGP